MVKVKICGITNLDDARDAVRIGADALGFNFVRGPRKITPGKAEEIISGLTAQVCKVGVFVNEDGNRVTEIVNRCGLTAVQLHGEETPEYCSRFHGKVKVIKAFRIKDEGSLEKLASYDVDFFLLDTLVEREEGETLWGGTGKTFDWSLAQKAKRFGRPVILAGGLNPENVREAVETVQPFAVDVASGVEKSPGRKDPERVKEFIIRAKFSSYPKFT